MPKNDMFKYVCWGDDHEDLTDKVQQIVELIKRGDEGEGTVPVPLTLPMADIDKPKGRPGKPKAQPRKTIYTIHVDCSNNHTNIFDVDIAEFPSGGDSP
jgi:hypothetical protein